jgi:acyl-CoA thioesterase-1
MAGAYIGPMHDPSSIDRRAALAGLAAAGVSTAAAAPVAAALRTVTVLGDSITAGYGVSAREALPAQLQAALDAIGAATEVRGAGVSGDTTSGGLRRADAALRGRPDVLLIALGGNDMLQGAPPSTVRRNLDAIVRKAKAAGVTPVLAGMRAHPLLGPEYQRAFDAIFPDLAREHGIAFYPFLLEGVALDARYNQPDRIHPNPAGVRLIAQRLAPVIVRALRVRKA